MGGGSDAGPMMMFEGVVALFVENGAQPHRLKIWKQKLTQRGGEIRQHINSTVTHIFAISLKHLEERVGRANIRKLRRIALRYEWLEDSLKAGRAVALEPYFLIDEEAKKLQAAAVAKQNEPELLPQPTSVPVADDERNTTSLGMAVSPGTPPKTIAATEAAGSFPEQGHEITKISDKMSISQGADSLGVTDSEESPLPSSQEPASTYSPPNLNTHITDLFAELKTVYAEALGDERRSFSYHKAISVLEKLDFKITSMDQVKGLPAIGKSMQDHIGEILKTGTLAKLQHFRDDPKVHAIGEFGKIWGIGPVKARKFYDKGHRSLEDLMTDEELSSAQKIGLKFHDDIDTKIPRHEAKVMEDIVRKAALSLQPDVIIVCGGSYRRGKAMVGDLDIVITHPDGESHAGFLRELVRELKDLDFLTEDLRTGMDHDSQGTERRVDTYLGLCRYPGREQRHRIDFKVYPYEQYPFGLIAWTGNDVLNRQLRLAADRKGYKLDDHGCFPVTVSADGEKVANRNWSVPCKSEREVFEFLEYEWLEPHERNL